MMSYRIRLGLFVSDFLAKIVVIFHVHPSCPTHLILRVLIALIIVIRCILSVCDLTTYIDVYLSHKTIRNHALKSFVGLTLYTLCVSILLSQQQMESQYVNCRDKKSESVVVDGVIWRRIGHYICTSNTLKALCI
jgi:hypothetical protein